LSKKTNKTPKPNKTHWVGLFLKNGFFEPWLDPISKLGQRLGNLYGDDRHARVLFQRISVMIQRFNSVRLHDSFCIDCLDRHARFILHWLSGPTSIQATSLTFILTVGIFTTKRVKNNDNN